MNPADVAGIKAAPAASARRTPHCLTLAGSEARKVVFPVQLSATSTFIAQDATHWQRVQRSSSRISTKLGESPYLAYSRAKLAMVATARLDNQRLTRRASSSRKMLRVGVGGWASAISSASDNRSTSPILVQHPSCYSILLDSPAPWLEEPALFPPAEGEVVIVLADP